MQELKHHLGNNLGNGEKDVTVFDSSSGSLCCVLGAQFCYLLRVQHFKHVPSPVIAKGGGFSQPGLLYFYFDLSQIPHSVGKNKVLRTDQ